MRVSVIATIASDTCEEVKTFSSANFMEMWPEESQRAAVQAANFPIGLHLRVLPAVRMQPNDFSL